MIENSIVLIYPYFKTKDNINQKLFNPLGIAQVSAILKQKNINVFKIDCTFKNLNEIVNEITKLNPKIIGFYSMISLSQNIYDLLKNLKSKLFDCLYLCGGPLATLYPLTFSKEFDIIFKGEINQQFCQFISAYLKNGSDKRHFTQNYNFSSVPGVYINNDSKFVNNPSLHLCVEEYQKLPLPDRQGFDHYEYQNFWYLKEGFRMTNIITTVGCPFQCDFCSKPIFGNIFRKRKLEKIFQEIKEIKDFGYDYLWIADDCFALDLSFLDRFCNKMIEKNLDLRWCCLSRVDTFKIKVLKKMKKAGCDKIFLGLESGNNNILKIMKKNITIEKTYKAVKQLKEAGIKTAGFFIIGYPGETWETINQTFKFALKLDLDEVSFNVPYPLPGSSLYQRVIDVVLNQDWTIENEIKFVYKSEFDENRIQQLINNFYKEYDLKKINY